MEFNNFFLSHFFESYTINYFVPQNSESEKVLLINYSK